MVSRRGFLLPAGGRGSFSRQPRSCNSGGGDPKGSWQKSDRYWGFPPRGLNTGGGGHRGDPPVSQEASWRGLGWGCARDPPGLLVVALLHSFGDSRSFCCADFLYIFPGIFGALLLARKPKIQKQKKTAS